MKDYASLLAQRDFEGLTINVFKGKPLEHPFFAKKEIFHSDISVDNDTLVRYICLFYDPKSPLLQKTGDHIERKKAAAVLAGWKVKNDKFSNDVVEILYCKNREANELIIEYLRALKMPEWTFLCAAWENFHKVNLDMMSEATTQSEKGSNKTSIDIAKTRVALQNEAKIMTEGLTQHTLKFVNGDESPYLHSDLFDMIDKTRVLLKITPERYLELEK